MLALHGGSKPPPYGAEAYNVRGVHGGQISRLACKAYRHTARCAYRVRSTYRICFACKANISTRCLASPPLPYNHPTKSDFSSKALLCLFIHEVDFIRQGRISLQAPYIPLPKPDFCYNESLASTHPPQAVPLSRLRTRSSFGSNNPLDCYSLPKLPLRYLTREGLSRSHLGNLKKRRINKPCFHKKDFAPRFLVVRFLYIFHNFPVTLCVTFVTAPYLQGAFCVLK